MRPTYLAIGHVTRDIIGGGSQIGGSVSYAALTARNLGERVGVVTSQGPDLNVAEVLTGIDLVSVPSPCSTTFELVYQGSQRGHYLRAVASPIEPQDVPVAWRDADIVHLAPVAQEVSHSIAQLFPRSFIGVTPQGWLRRRDAQGRISRTGWWRGAEKLLARADAVVLSEDDVAGGARAIDFAARQTKMLVVTRGERGADLFLAGRVHRYAAFATRVVDPTGAGDTFAAAFFVELRRHRDPFQAMRFASCAASFTIAKTGLQGVPTLEQVRERLSLEP